MNITWINQFTQSQIDEVSALMKNEWWCASRTMSQVEKVIKHFDIVIGALDSNGVLSGFARVLTDFTFKAVIYDVIVKPNYRDVGLGKEIMQHIFNSPTLKEVKSFELYCPDKVSGFYQKLGFTISESRLHQYKNQ